MRIAFHPTLKATDHPIPSGDREMARLLLAALALVGHEVVQPSTLRSFAKTPDPMALDRLEGESAAEVQRLLAHWRQQDRSLWPDLWFTYHLYYKAPDLIGPAVSRALRIPYVVAEASHAQKRNSDAWQPRQAHVETALAAASAVFCLTEVDRQGLTRLANMAGKLVDLPPFIDTSAFEAPHATAKPHCGKLVTVAMMRHGAKLQSYQFLAAALGHLGDRTWRLTIVGDGPARGAVESAFSSFGPDRVRFAGLCPREKLPALLASANLFVWPGFEEAYGIVYLEGQAAGLPVLALNRGGIASTLLPGKTGVLVENADPAEFARCLAQLLDNPLMCQAMGANARDFILAERNLRNAAAILTNGLNMAKEMWER